MNQKFNKTILLVFSLSVAEESRRKPFHGLRSTSASVALCSRFIQDTRKLAAGTNLEILWSDERQQQGHSFGERFSNAINSCFENGYERVIAIGNDTPDLTAEMVQTAATKLLDTDLVLGPSADGGIYLLGITKKAFAFNGFVSLPWQQDALYDTLVFNATSQGQEVISLEKLADLDNVDSAKAYIRNQSTSKISKLLISLFIISSQSSAYLPYIITLTKQRMATNLFRGPPVIISA